MTDRKNWIEIFIMPLVIASVGILGTYFITQQQEDNAKSKADLDRQLSINRADSDRQIKIIEIFSEKITSNDEKQRMMALRLLRVLDDELAEKLASAAAEAERTESDAQKLAQKVVDVAKARINLLPRVYIHVKSSNEVGAAQEVEKLLSNNEWIVPGIQKMGQKTLGSSQLRYFRKNEKETVDKIQLVLKNNGHDIAVKYIPGYENSKSLRPMHFEIWFSEGEPRSGSS